jgi:ankyrin repeat protein
MRSVGSVDRSKALIAVGADVHAKNGEGRTALWLAVDRRPIKSEVVKVLLDAGADGRQALILAAWRSHGCVQQLLDAHVDPNAQDDEGHRPLSRAIEIRAVDTVRQLLKARASVAFEVHGGCSPLHLATGPYGHAEIVGLLLSHNASPNEANAKGFTALMRAASHKHEGVVRTLIAAQANVHAQDMWGRTPLSMAAGHEAISQQLKDAGAKE